MEWGQNESKTNELCESTKWKSEIKEWIRKTEMRWDKITTTRFINQHFLCWMFMWNSYFLFLL